MKLVSLIEDQNPEETQDQNPEETPEIQTYNRIVGIINKIKDTIGFFSKDFDYPEGTFQLRTYTKLEPAQHLGETYGKQELSLHFIPKLDNPTLPLDIIHRPVNLYIKVVKEEIPEIMEQPDLYPREALNKIEIRIADYYVRCGRALYNINEFIPRAVFNTMIRGVAFPLGDLLYDPSITDMTMFQQGELPVFAPNYKAVHDNAIKRTMTIVKAYRKGKWKGHTYDLGKISPSDILLLDNHKEPLVINGVIRPMIWAHLSLPSPIIDGFNRWSNQLDYPFTEKDTEEFNQYIDKLLLKYNIKYR